MNLKMEGLEGCLEGLFCYLGRPVCGDGRIGRINKPTPQHMCALAHMYEYDYIILPILPSLDSKRSSCPFYPSKCLHHPSISAFDPAELWSMERPGVEDGDAERVAWHIAYLLAGEMDAEERAELKRLRRVQRWLVVAPERRAALRVVIAASAVVRLITVMGGAR